MEISLKTLLATSIMMLTFGVSAQIKVHSDGRISFLTTGTSGGIQMQSDGFASFEPNFTASYSRMNQTYSRNTLSKCWIVKSHIPYNNIGHDVFYVTGYGNVYGRGHYVLSSGGLNKNGEHITDALKLLSGINGYYYKSTEFDGCDGQFDGNENVFPEAISGLLNDLNVKREIGIDPKELERVLPEVIRHGPECEEYINYPALVPILLEAIKEQQKQIEELYSMIRKNK